MKSLKEKLNQKLSRSDSQKKKKKKKIQVVILYSFLKKRIFFNDILKIKP